MANRGLKPLTFWQILLINLCTSKVRTFLTLSVIWCTVENGREHLVKFPRQSLTLMMFFLHKHAADYRSCKDRSENKAIHLNSAKQKQRVLIEGSLKGSKISFSGMTSNIFKSLVEAAQDLSRIGSYLDEKRQLSIVAMDFSYSTLQQYFQCSSKTITAAKVHYILFGRGGVPSDKYQLAST